MDRHKAHTRINALSYLLDKLVGNLGVRHMTPPDKHVGAIKDVIGQTVIGIVESRKSYLNVLGLDKSFDKSVNTVRVKLLHVGLELFMTIFIPNRYVYSHFFTSFEIIIIYNTYFSIILSKCQDALS